MSKTNIEWTDYSWNWVTGCNKVSAGCKNCYAESIANRFWKDRKFTDVQIDESKLSLPIHLKKPRMIFVNSMSDFFHEKISFEIMEKAWGVMTTNPRHTYQILTKRPKRMLEFCKHMSEKIHNAGYEKINGWAFHIPDFICMGVSVENQQAADERIPLLLQTPAAVRWLSVEPMLENINIAEWFDPTHPHLVQRLKWIVIGCESGHNRRECKIEWFEDIVRQCKEAGVSVFVKQLQLNGKVVKDIKLFPKNLKVREYPKV